MYKHVSQKRTCPTYELMIHLHDFCDVVRTTANIGATAVTAQFKGGSKKVTASTTITVVPYTVKKTGY